MFQGHLKSVISGLGIFSYQTGHYYNRPPVLDIYAKTCEQCGQPIGFSTHGERCGLIIAGKECKTNMGTVRGVAPACDLYLYPSGCSRCKRMSKLVISSLERAVEEGIRIVSLSTGSYTAKPSFSTDSFGIASLKAFGQGVLVYTSAGNACPKVQLSVRAQPWTLVVGACSGGMMITSCLELGVTKKEKIRHGLDIIGGTSGDYKFVDKVKIPFSKLGSNKDFCSLRIYKDHKPMEFNNKESILVWTSSATLVLRTYNDNTKHWPKLNDGRFATQLSVDATRALLYWLVQFPDTLFLRKTESFEEDSRACFVRTFSSRGYVPLFKEFIMPDVLAPGEVITSVPDKLLSISLEKSLSELFSAGYVKAGTSFSCPIVAGVAARVLQKHPDWGPSAIKSAIVTTAKSLAQAQVPGTEFAFGAGVVDPINAINPGLLYEEEASSFERYTSGGLSVDELNLPSIAAHFPDSHIKSERVFVRRVKCVGAKEPMTYKGAILFSNRTLDPDVEITVTPRQLNFRKEGDVKEFKVIAKVSPHPWGHISALLQWTCDNKNLPSVRSPIHLYEHIHR